MTMDKQRVIDTGVLSPLYLQSNDHAVEIVDIVILTKQQVYLNKTSKFIGHDYKIIRNKATNTANKNIQRISILSSIEEERLQVC